MFDQTSESPYRVRLDYLSAEESAFFHVLYEIVKEQFFVCPKVALTDLFFVARPNENVHHATKLQRKKVDFLLLWRENLKPAVAIELDYPKQTDHRSSDSFLDTLFLSAGLPLIHVTVMRSYDISSLARQVTRAVELSASYLPAPNDYSPICPRCGITMVLRFDKEGPLNGQKYYGCLNFPTCQEIISVS